MALLRLSASARRDLENIRRYFDAIDPRVSADLANRFAKALQLLSRHPGVGHCAVGLEARVWSIPGIPYLVYYEIVGDCVRILHIRDSRRAPLP